MHPKNLTADPLHTAGLHFSLWSMPSRGIPTRDKEEPPQLVSTRSKLRVAGRIFATSSILVSPKRGGEDWLLRHKMLVGKMYVPVVLYHFSLRSARGGRYLKKVCCAQSSLPRKARCPICAVF